MDPMVSGSGFSLYVLSGFRVLEFRGCVDAALLVGA